MTKIQGTNGNLQDYKTYEKQGKKSYDEFSKSAFDAYKQFKEQSEAEYKNYKNNIEKEYEEFRNSAAREYDTPKSNIETGKNSRGIDNKKYAEALANPDNWQEYEAHEGIKPPVMNKPTTPPVYTPEQPVMGTPVEEDKHIIDQEPVNYDESSQVKNKPATEPPAEVKDAAPVVQEEKTENTPPPTPQTDEKPVFKEISRNGVTGGYSITPGENGNGYSLKVKMQVKMNGEASKFFVLNDKGGNKITYDQKTGVYSFRGIKSDRMSFLQARMDMASQTVSINNAIYNDLITKQKSGTELTDAEQSFIKSHLSNLEQYGLGLDENGNIIEKN